MGKDPLWAHNLPADELTAMLAEGIVSDVERERNKNKRPSGNRR